MRFLDSFFPSTGSDIDVRFYPSTNFIAVGMEFKYAFLFRPENIAQFKFFKITSDTGVTVSYDSLK